MRGEAQLANFKKAAFEFADGDGDGFVETAGLPKWPLNQWPLNHCSK